MADTFMRGIDPRLERLFIRIVNDTFVNYNNIILNNIEFKKKKSSVQKKLHDTLDDVVNHLHKEFDYIIKKEFEQKIMTTVQTLSKEEIAEMAESLIYLTTLKRKMSFGEEETVGGPIDVAVITKGDGFIWIKHKHYFDPELNYRFIAKYFRNNS